MNNKIFYTIVIFFFVTTISRAQYDPDALEILDTMSEMYEKMESFQVSLTIELTNQMEGIEEEMTGKVTVKKNKFRLELADQLTVTDGKTIWTYLPSVQEVTINEFDSDDNDMNPTTLFTLYKKGYKYLYLGSKIEGKIDCHMVDLVPESREAQYFKIRMNIAKKDNKLQSWIFFDKEGNQFKYTVEKFRENISPEDSFFLFDKKKHPDVEIVDLR